MCTVQVSIAQDGNPSLAAQMQPQAITPWTPPANPPPGALTATAFIAGPSIGYKESWFSTNARWCQPSNQSSVTGPGERSWFHKRNGQRLCWR